MTDRFSSASDAFEPAGAAFTLANNLARNAGGGLFALHVLPASSASMSVVVQHQAPPVQGRSNPRRTGTRPCDDVNLEHRYLTGDPVEEIVRCADENDVDLVVIGTYAQSGLWQVVVRDVAEEVARRADCPVLIVDDQLGELDPPYSNTDSLLESSDRST